MAYKSALPSILSVLELLNSTPAEGATTIHETFPMPLRRFLARTAQQWERGDEDTLCILCTLLGDTICDVRAEAYYSLIRCTELHGALLLSELEKHPEQEPWVQIARARLLRQLASIDVCRVLLLLRPLAASGITWVEREVATCLSTCWILDREVTWQVMEDWLRHRSADVREVAVRFISTGYRPEGRTAPAVLQTMVDDPASQVRTVCAQGISIWAWEDLDLSIPALKSLAMDRSHWNVRAAVVRGLTHWRKAAPYDALDVLLPLLHDAVAPVRRVAFRQLGALRREFTNLTIDIWSGGAHPADGAENLRGPKRHSCIPRRASERRRGGQRVLS